MRLNLSRPREIQPTLHKRTNRVQTVRMIPELEEGLHLVEDTDEDEQDQGNEAPLDSDLESLRSEFVAGFNARDLDAVLAVVASDVECPDRHASGARELAVELAAIWDRSPDALLTPALLDGTPCAVAWLPDDLGSWCRAALVCFDADDGLLRLIELPDDPDALDRAETDLPDPDDLDQDVDWS